MNMVREAVSSLLRQGKIQVPAVPGFSTDNWLTDQSSTLQKVLMRAKKGRQEDMDMNPDTCDTVPWPVDEEDPLDPNQDTSIGKSEFWCAVTEVGVLF